MISGTIPPDPESLQGYLALAEETQPLRLKRISEEETAFATERLLAETKGAVSQLLTRLTAELQELRISSWDELVDNPCCDSVSLAGRLQPMEYHVTFISDTKDRLEVRINEARVTRLTATVEKCKAEFFEAQLLAAISIIKTEVAMKPIRDAEGGVLVFGVRSQQLRAAAEEKKRLVGLAEAAPRDEVTRQLIAEQARMASGTITRAQIR
jgi:hypothetical protein